MNSGIVWGVRNDSYSVFVASQCVEYECPWSFLPRWSVWPSWSNRQDYGKIFRMHWLFRSNNLADTLGSN